MNKLSNVGAACGEGGDKPGEVDRDQLSQSMKPRGADGLAQRGHAEPRMETCKGERQADEQRL